MTVARLVFGSVRPEGKHQSIALVAAVRPRLVRAAGAAQAERGRGIERQAARLDRLAAGHALAIGATRQPFQRGIDASELDLPATLDLDSHRLLLHGLDARHPTEPRLVELDGTTIVLMGGGEIQQLGATGAQTRLYGGIRLRAGF